MTLVDLFHILLVLADIPIRSHYHADGVSFEPIPKENSIRIRYPVLSISI
ncbi:hypothetical protein C7972_10243 [Arenibacter sp. ARW7G5Y1]|nr:hypothetical protein C7972_10243 [Arenibacter sp. ARW7G5Y1]